MRPKSLKNLVIAGLFVALLPAVSNGERVERIYVLAEALGKTVRKAIGDELQQQIGSELDPGSVVHVVLSPGHKTLATFVVPFGNSKHRLMRPELRPGWQAIGPWIKNDLEQGSLQVDLPRLLAKVDSLKQTRFPTEIVIVGTLAYDDPQFPNWKFVPLVPSDGCLKAVHCPFTGGVGNFPPHTKVRWLILAADAKLPLLVREKLVRFYRLFFQLHQAELLQVSDNPATASRFDLNGFRDKVGLEDSRTDMIDPTFKTVVKKLPPAEVTWTPLPPNPVQPVMQRDARQVPAPKKIPPRTQPKKPQPAIVPQLVPEVKSEPHQPEPEAVSTAGNFVFVRDCSGSIIEDLVSGEKVSWKNDLINSDICSRLRTMNFDKFLVIGYNGAEDRDGNYSAYYRFTAGQGWTPAWLKGTQENRGAACEAVKNWSCGGGTPTLEALEKAAAMEGATTIFLYSDGGLSKEQYKEIVEYVRTLKQQGITVHTFCFGRNNPNYCEVGAAWMREIAQQGGGKYFAL